MLGERGHPAPAHCSAGPMARTGRTCPAPCDWRAVRVGLDPEAPVMRDLDALPLPAWDLVDTAALRGHLAEKPGFLLAEHGHHARLSLQVQLVRQAHLWQPLQQPLAGSMWRDELELLQRLHRPDHIWFADDIFGLKPGWVQRFRDVLRERGWNCATRCRAGWTCCWRTTPSRRWPRAGWRRCGGRRERQPGHPWTPWTKAPPWPVTRRPPGGCRRTASVSVTSSSSATWGETPEQVEETIRMVERTLPDDIGVSFLPAAGHQVPRPREGRPGRQGHLDRQRRPGHDVPEPPPARVLINGCTATHKRFRRAQALRAGGRWPSPAPALRPVLCRPPSWKAWSALARS